MPPHVPVPKPGPCKGTKRAVKKAAGAVSNVKPKSRAKAKKAPARLTAAQVDAREKQIEKALVQARQAYGGGIRAPKRTGDFWADRDTAIRELARDMYATYAGVPAQGKAIFSGGVTGSGKTTALRKIADPGGYVSVNPDEAKEEMARRGWIPDVPGGSGLTPMELSTLVHDDSIRVSELIADMAMRDRKNILWDATMNDPYVAEERINWLRENGYDDIRGVLVTVPAEVSQQRTRQRWLDGVEAARAGEGLGGRYIPPWVFRGQTPVNSRRTFERVKELLDGWAEFSSPDARTPVEQTGSGGRPWPQ